MRSILVLALALVLCAPAVADAAAPGFVGMVSEDTIAGTPAYRDAQLAQMHARGVTLLRQTFDWSVVADGPAGRATSVMFPDAVDATRVDRRFALSAGLGPQVHDLTLSRRLGANLIALPDGKAAVRFAVYAPNATAVSLVFGDRAIGYIADDGTGERARTPMTRDGDVWSALATTGGAPNGALVGTPYMFLITRADGSKVYRTDLFSRAQIGAGDCDPLGRHCNGPPEHIDGTKSCSLVCDPDHIIEDDGSLVPADRFWANEFDPASPLPNELQDLVIYELHVGALGFAKAGAGTLDDAIAFIDHLVELGVNAVELLPIAEFQGDVGWGYSTSHFCAIEQSAGGAARLKHFVRACHRRGIVVILDVVYNHYDSNAERAEWMYDATEDDKNFCYWYEGKPSDYRHGDTGEPFPEGGYIDNQSTGFAPNYRSEVVRQLFISSAAAFVVDFHVDGFRVDQTTSIHDYAALHVNNQISADAAKIGGNAFLRQWTQTLRLIKKPMFLMAEDHSTWPAVTQPYKAGTDALGFDARWYSDFYHHLVDFGEGGDEWAKLLRNAGYGDGRKLHIDFFAGALGESGHDKVCYNDSHDEAGNSKNSARTICLAVNNAPLVGDTRKWAESRCRLSAGLALLSAGIPMFFMGEEVGASQPYRYNDFLDHREDIAGLKQGSGANLFRYYKDLIALSRDHDAIRSKHIEVLYTHDDNRLIVFLRKGAHHEVLVVACFNDAGFDHGYRMSHPAFAGGGWREIFNSDATVYGGRGVGNGGATLQPSGADCDPIVPAAGLVVFRRG